MACEYDGMYLLDLPEPPVDEWREDAAQVHPVNFRFNSKHYRLRYKCEGLYVSDN